MEGYKFDKILVPINFSKTSSNALQTAIAMAVRHGSELLLVHIIVPDLVFVTHEGGILMDTGMDNYTRNATRKLKDLTHQLHRDYAINCSYSIQSGPIISTIVNIATEKCINLIVIGSSFKPGWQTFLSGSPAFAILKYAPCPVLTIPAYKQWLNFKHILFPIRPSVSALEKYNYAHTIIRKNNARLIVVGVLDRLRTKMFRILDQESRYIITLLKNKGIRTKTQFHFCDSMAEMILKQAHAQKVDLLIITASLDYSMHEFFKGSYARQIFIHARVPVLSIKSSIASPLQNQSL